jgi:hypothetical protein
VEPLRRCVRQERDEAPRLAQSPRRARNGAVGGDGSEAAEQVYTQAII